MEEFSDSAEEDEVGVNDGNDAGAYTRGEAVTPNTDTDAEVAPSCGDTDLVTPGDDTDDRNNEVAPPAVDIGDRNNEVVPPGEEGENYGSTPTIPFQALVTEHGNPSLYLRSIVEQAGINVSDNLTVSTSESEEAAPEFQGSPEDDAEQPVSHLQSPHRGEISLQAVQNIYNPYQNMRLIMESEFGQSCPAEQVPPAAGPYLSERNFNMEQIVSIWEMPDIYRREQLLNRFFENSLYRPNIVQRGGRLALLHLLTDIPGTNGDTYALRASDQGVLLNNQDLLEPLNGLFRLGHEYFPVHCYNKNTLRCSLQNRDPNFIRKTYFDNEWCGEQMIVPFLCESSSIVQPWGLTWSGREIQVFLPDVQGESLADLMKHRGQGLTQPEVMLLSYWLLKIVSVFQRCNCLHRNITPDSIIISHENQRLYLVGNRAMCRQHNALSWIPSNLSLFSAPELVRGEEHPRADLYSAGCAMISALNYRIPNFDINGIQRTMRNYLFSIGQGFHSPTEAFIATLGLDNNLEDVLIAMVTPGVTGQLTAEDILQSYFRNPEPLWSNSFFQPTPPAIPDIRRAEGLHQEHVNIPSDEILSSASDQVEVTNQEESSVGEKCDDGDSQLDSGRFTSTSSEFCTIKVAENGIEVCTFSLPWNELGSKVYIQLKAKMNISDKYVLLHNGLVLKFDKHLHELPETHPTMPLCLHLRRQDDTHNGIDSMRQDRTQDLEPPDFGSRSNQRSESGSRTVIEGAAYNGNDHVVYDEPVQACNQSSMIGERDQFGTSDFDDNAVGASNLRKVPSTLALTGVLAESRTGRADPKRFNRSCGPCAYEDANKEDIEKSTVGDVISHEQFTLYEDEEDLGEEEQPEVVCPGDIGDEEGSRNADEGNVDDVEQENELLDEGGETPSDFRSTNMERQMSLEEQVDAIIFQGRSEDGEGRGRNDPDSDESVCGYSQTSSEENFTEDEGDVGNEEGECDGDGSSRYEPRVSVDPEGSDSESGDKVERGLDNEMNGSESDEFNEEDDSGLTDDATESSSFTDVGVTVTNESLTPLSEDCGLLEDDDQQ